MQTEAVFENIAERIQQEISKAQKTIFIAVAWFTNKNIFNELIRKSNEGCSISLIISNDKINENSTIDFEQLNIHNSRVYKIGNGETELMHNKFCVIDYNTCISGSYNWSYKAEHNYENIIVSTNQTTLAKQFVTEFNSIKKKYYPNENDIEIEFPLEKIIKRLEILKNLIVLEDIEELSSNASKLSVYRFNEDIDYIIKAVENQKYSEAIHNIQIFITSYQQLSIWNDPEVAGLKLEIKILENQLNAFDNEKIELEKILSDFQHRHTNELGEIILEILKLKKELNKNNPKKSKEAREDYKNYNKQFNIEKDKFKYEITDEGKIELKKNFRKASTLCHPDKVTEEKRLEASQIFVELKEAYDQQDIAKVNKILKDLEEGNFFASQSDTISEKKLLKAAFEKLKIKLEQLKHEVIYIKESEIFIEVNNIKDWDSYFQETKVSLEKELEEFRVKLLSYEK